MKKEIFIKNKKKLILTIMSLMILVGCTNANETSVKYEEESKQVIKEFIDGINQKESNNVKELCSDKMVLVEKYIDGNEYKEESKEGIYSIIESRIDDNTFIDIQNINFMKKNTFEVLAKVKDYSTEILKFDDGIRIDFRFEIKDNKVTYFEMKRNEEDEIEFNERINGTIGIKFNYIDDMVIIEEIIDGNSADKAGLKAGDIIEEIDGKKVSEIKHGLYEVAYRIKGPAGTSVRLKINRAGEILDFNVDRVEF